MSLIDTIVSSVPIASILAGLYSVVVYIALISTTSFSSRLSNYGIAGHLSTYVIILFTFGYVKHEIGYYLTLESNYCKQTQVCREDANNQQLNLYSPESWITAAKHTFGFLQNIWLEAIGEGILFVLVGVPVFWYVRPQWAAAFFVGLFAHLASSYSGFHQYFCKTTCNWSPNW